MRFVRWEHGEQLISPPRAIWVAQAWQISCHAIPEYANVFVTWFYYSLWWVFWLRASLGYHSIWRIIQSHVFTWPSISRIINQHARLITALPDQILPPCNYCHHPWCITCIGDKSYHKALLTMFRCNGMSGHAGKAHMTSQHTLGRAKSFIIPSVISLSPCKSQ